MFTVVPTVAIFQMIIIFHERQSGGHLQVGQRPTAPGDVEIFAASLQVDADGFRRCVADHGRVLMTTANICEAADMAEHFAKLVRSFPRYRPRANPPGTDATDGSFIGVFR